jgi:hypothetical protein
MTCEVDGCYGAVEMNVRNETPDDTRAIYDLRAACFFLQRMKPDEG